jgi:hypothetical protein
MMRLQLAVAERVMHAGRSAMEHRLARSTARLSPRARAAVQLARRSSAAGSSSRERTARNEPGCAP